MFEANHGRLAITAEAPHTPSYYYDIPVLTGVMLSMEKFPTELDELGFGEWGAKAVSANSAELLSDG